MLKVSVISEFCWAQSSTLRVSRCFR